MAEQPNQSPSATQLADLSALADGSLDPRRRPAVEQWIADSPQLRALYARERAAVEALQHAAGERAPARLRMQIDSQRASRASWWRRNTGYAALAGAIAVVAVALALLLPGGAPGSPSVSQAAQLALRGPSAAAPLPDPSDPRVKLTERVQGLYFPNWAKTLGWRPVGVRRDTLAGRRAVTVYYRRGAMEVAYTIIGTPVLAQPSAPVKDLSRVSVRAINLHGRTVVTWRRAGHTCVLSAAAVPTRVLEKLANWPTPRLTD